MKYGNCLIYALWQLLVTGGRIEMDWTSVTLKLPRFWHVNRFGEKTRFAPVKPRNGWPSLPHKLCYRGKITHAQAYKNSDRR